MIDRNNLNRIKGVLSARQGAEIPKYQTPGGPLPVPLKDIKSVENKNGKYYVNGIEVNKEQYDIANNQININYNNAANQKGQEVLGSDFASLNASLNAAKDELSAKLTYKPFIKSADIVKFSDDELYLFTGETDVIKGCEKIANKGQLIIVTLGKKGSLYYIDNKSEIVPTIPVTPVDTTGAGDAFYGTFLAYIENKEYTSENLTSAMKIANQKGAETTLFKGAIKL